MKNWGQRFRLVVADNARGVRHVTAHPATDRSSRRTTTLWAFAAATAVASIGLYVSQGAVSFILWMDVAVLALDVYMLWLCIQGIRYRRSLRGRRRALP